MKITQIIKGKVKKEEEREFAFSYLSLNRIEARIRNSEGSSYQAAQLIHDVVSYDPSKANNAQLADDMRICFAWYSSIKEGFSDVKERVKKFKFSEKDVVHLAKAIYIEIEKRKRAGKMKHEWNPEEMKKHSKDLFGIISKSKPLQTSLVTKENEEVNTNVPTTLEKLAELEHAQWSHWTKHMLGNLTEENIKRWKEQIETPYFKLSEKEKESDREWARKALLIFEESKKMLDSKDQGCGKAWEVLFAEGMAVQYFEHEKDARTFADEVNKCSTDEGFAKDVIHVNYSFVHRHTKTKRCYGVNKKAVHFKCSRDDDFMRVKKLEQSELDPEIKKWFRNNLPIYPGGTSDNYEPIELAEFLDKWNSFSIRKPFISLVGSLANWNRTEGDIDILVKAHDPSQLLGALDKAIVKCFQIGEEQMADLLIQANQFIHTDSLFLATQWRIKRAFPEWSDRLHVLDDSFSGPFTNFVDLSDLTAAAREEKVREEMAKVKKLKLFEWFPMLKPIHGRKKEEIYSVDSVIETIKSRKDDWFETGIYVEIKFDGVHIQCHKSGDRVKVLTEDGRDVTKNCLTLVAELKDINADFILCGEMELWKEGKHQPRADCAGVLNSKAVHPDERSLRFNVFDILWHNEDIHKLPFSERIKHLNQFSDSYHIKKAKRILCHSEAEVRKAIKKVSSEEGSEGAYLKKADFIYELDGKTLNNIKYKLEISLDAVVLKKSKVAKTKQTFYYHCGLKSDSEMVYCGKTFNTNIDAKVGDIIKVVFVDISGYADPTTKKRWVNWWSPRVIMLRTDKKVPDSIDTAWKMVKQTTGRFESKKTPDIKKLEQLESKGKRFDFKHHFRGASEHIDKRFQINHVLDGFTSAAQHPDLLKAELSKHWKLEKSKDMYSLYWDGELAYQLDKKENIVKEPSAALKKKIYDLHVALHEDPKYWKIDMETGEEKKRKGAEKEEVEKIFCVKKKKEPFEWLDVVGVTKPREIEPEPGGTRFYPGIFVPIDSGVYYSGAQKPYFKEYFLDGKKWKGRFVFRLVAGLKGSKAVANWLYWKPSDQSPYVLSSRAIKDNWLPTEGSAMSPEWEKKLPEELHFWKAKGREKQLELRKLAREYLKKKKEMLSKGERQFILTNRNWKGQHVVRGLPFEDYHLKIDAKKFHLDKDPSSSIPASGISALTFEGKEGYFKPGKKEPKTEVNPNVEISAFIEVLDKGKVEIIADEPLYLHVRFKGKKLKGLYHFRRTSRQSEFWTFKKGMQSFS